MIILSNVIDFISGFQFGLPLSDYPNWGLALVYAHVYCFYNNRE